jgi:hypothetical protein
VRQFFEGDWIGALASRFSEDRFQSTAVQDGIVIAQSVGCATADGQLLRRRIEELMAARQGRPTQDIDEERKLRLLSPEWAKILRVQPQPFYTDNPTIAWQFEEMELKRLEERKAAAARDAERAEYQRAAGAGTTAALYAYLQKYGGNALYRRDAERDLARLDSRAYQAAQNANTHAAYKQYLREFPSGASANLVTGRVALIERQAFAQASSTNTAAAYADYLRQYPGSADEYAARTALNRLDRDAFGAALKARSETGFRRYLSQVPGGVYRNQADEWLNANANAARLRSEINKASSEITAARAKTVSRGAVTGVALAATAGLGWVTLTNIAVVDSLERELQGLGAEDPQRAPMTADRTAALRNTAIYGVGATAAFVIAVKVWNGARGCREASAAASERKKELETNLKAVEQRQRQIEATRVSLAPYRGRGGNGLQLSWSF